MIYVFYSYKGGVGRTFTLAHCAISIAAQRREAKQKVLAMDLDLEASGLHRYLRPVESPQMRGFAGLLADYVDARGDADWLGQSLREDLALPPAERRYVASVQGTENLFLIPSGVAPDQPKPVPLPKCTTLLLDVLSQAPATEAQGPEDAGFVRQLRNALAREFLYVLVDSRTGLSDPAYFSTVLLGDCIVGCVRLNDENIEGMRVIIGNRLARMDDESKPPKRLPLVIVATLVPPRGGEDVEEWMRKAESLVPQIDDNDPAVSHRTLFPKAISLPRDENLELGERMALKPSGEPAQGYTAGAPVLAQLKLLTRRLLAENCDRDPLAAQIVEDEFRDNRRDPLRALPYLFKRIEADPANPDHWEDIGKGYLEIRFNPTILAWLGGVIKRWSGEQETDPGARQKLSLAHRYRAVVYGQSSPDGGLQDGERALELGSGTPTEAETASVVAQIIEELVERKHPSATLRDGTELSYGLANEYYTRAIQAFEHAGRPPGMTWVGRARNFRRIDREDLAVGDYDQFISQAASEEKTQAAANALVEQSEALEHIGWYLAALRNLLAAQGLVEAEDALVEGLDLAFALLGLLPQATKWLEARRGRVRSDEKLYLRQALVRLVCGDIEGSIHAAQVARAFSPKMVVPLVHAVALFLKGDMEEADRLLGEIAPKDRDGYDRGLCALSRLYLKHEDALAEATNLPRDAGCEWMLALACAAAGQANAREFPGPEAGDALGMQVQGSVIQIARFGLLGEWRQDLADAVDGHLRGRPYLGVRCRWDVDMRVVRKAWDDWIRARVVNAEARDWLDSFWRRVEATKSPPPEFVTPRDPAKPFEPDPAPPIDAATV